MKKCKKWEGTSQEVNCTIRRTVMQLHQPGESVLVVGADHVCLVLREDKCRNAREKDGKCIDLLRAEGGCRISSVPKRHTYRENTKERPPVC